MRSGDNADARAAFDAAEADEKVVLDEAIEFVQVQAKAFSTAAKAAIRQAVNARTPLATAVPPFFYGEEAGAKLPLVPSTEAPPMHSSRLAHPDGLGSPAACLKDLLSLTVGSLGSRGPVGQSARLAGWGVAPDEPPLPHTEWRGAVHHFRRLELVARLLGEVADGVWGQVCPPEPGGGFSGNVKMPWTQALHAWVVPVGGGVADPPPPCIFPSTVPPLAQPDVEEWLGGVKKRVDELLRWTPVAEVPKGVGGAREALLGLKYRFEAWYAEPEE